MQLGIAMAMKSPRARLRLNSVRSVMGLVMILLMVWMTTS